MSTIYTVGFQPVDIVSRKHKLVDVLNLVIEKGVPSNNLTTEVIKYLCTFNAENTDYLLLNSVATRNIIPYCKFANSLVYDPAYVATSTEILKLLQQLALIIGDKNSENIYLHPLNDLRALLQHYKENIPQSVYFNMLTVLTDANKSDTLSLQNYIMRFTDPLKGKFTRQAIFMGDPIDPGFFDYLNTQGVSVIKFLPYDFFTLPTSTLDTAYYSNPYFQSPLSNLIELKRELFGSQLEQRPNMLILNPGGIYLSPAEAEYYRSELASAVPIYTLPGMYKGVTLQL